MSERRADLWCALFLIAVAIALFGDVLFLGNNFWFRDLFLYHLPMKHVVRAITAGGQFPWWNPYWGGGQPMAANPAYEIFYPPQWLIFVGPYLFGFAVHIVAHIVIAMVGMYAFLRSIPLQRFPSLFGSLSFGLSGFFLGTMTNLPTFFVWSWAGVVGWAVLRLVRGGSLAPAAIAIALPMLVLEPMALVQMLALVIVGAAFVDRRSLPRLIGAIVVAVAIAAVVIIPAIDHAHDSARSRGFAFSIVTDYSMPPARPVELIAPRAFGVLPDIHTWWGFRLFGFRGTPYFLSIYCGAAVAILALAAIVTRQRGAIVVVGICAISYILAIGSHTPLFTWLYAVGLRSIRYPEKFIAAGLVTLIVFAAIALDRIAQMRRAVVAIAIAVAALLWISVAVMTPSVFSSLWHAAPQLSPLARGGLLMAAVFATLWAIIFRHAGPVRIWNLLAIAVLLFDLGPLSNQILPRMPRQFFTPPPVVASLGPDATVFHRGEWTQTKIARISENIYPALALRNCLRGYSATLWGLPLALEADFDETYLLPTHDLLNAMMQRGNSGDPRWSEPFVAISNVNAILDYREGSIENPLTITRVPAAGRFWFAKQSGRVLTLNESASSASLDVDAKPNAFLIVTITRHKYWRASIDGVEAELLPANIAYQGLRVPPGRHRIELRYRNPLVKWSAAISLLAFVATVVIPSVARKLGGSAARSS